jgi:hypothetical protein
MTRLDRLVNAIRGVVERALPWYDPAEAIARHRETERIRRRSIAARIRAEQVAASYERADGALGR